MTSSVSFRATTEHELSPPRFFADRCLGKLTIQRLRELGWDIVTLADAFSDDAQAISDDEWIEHCSRQGWAGLTKDKRIRRQTAYQQSSTPIFALSNGQVTIDVMVERFEAARAKLWRVAGNGTREFWLIYEGGRLERRDP